MHGHAVGHRQDGQIGRRVTQWTDYRFGRCCALLLVASAFACTLAKGASYASDPGRPVVTLRAEWMQQQQPTRAGKQHNHHRAAGDDPGPLLSRSSLLWHSAKRALVKLAVLFLISGHNETCGALFQIKRRRSALHGHHRPATASNSLRSAFQPSRRRAWLRPQVARIVGRASQPQWHEMLNRRLQALCAGTP